MGTVSFLSSVCVHQVRECALNSEETMRLFPLYLMFLVSLVSGAPSDLGQFGTILDGGLQIFDAISPQLVGVAQEGKVDAYQKIVDIVYKLVEAQKKVMKDVVDKKVKIIEKKVEEIEDEMDKIQSKELEARKKTLLMIKKSRKEFQIIRRNLEGLASETVRRVDELVLIINSDAVSDEEKFELEVERMISLMKRSREVIETSVKRYHEIDESLNKAHNELKALKYFIDDLIREGKATKDAKERSRKGTDIVCGTATAVLGTGLMIFFNIALPGVGNAIAIPLTAAGAGSCWGASIGLENAINGLNVINAKTVATSLRILEAFEPVIKDVKDFENDIEVELDLLQNWETELEYMKDHFKSTEKFDFALKVLGKEQMIEMLNRLKKVCQEYLLGNTLTETEIKKWISKFNAELEADIYEYITIETFDDENEIQNAFEDLDADGNKLISKDELQKKATTSGQDVEGVVSDVTQYMLSEFVEKTMKKVDIDGDGQINFEEYQKIKKKSV